MSGAAGMKYLGKARFLAGASCAALAIACSLATQATAANYTVANSTQLINAIAAANASADPSSTITLTNSFTLPSNTTLPMPTKSITIDTQGFVLSGSTSGGNNGINFGNNVLLSGALTVNGAFVGGNSGSIAVPGAGLNISSSVGSAGQVTNNGSITGGNALVTAKTAGVGVNILNDATLVNNGSISGGVANAYLRPIGSIQGNGVSLGNGSTLINNVGATVQGGNSQGIGAGAGLYMNATARAVTATNYGTIRGGSDLTGTVAGNAAVRGLSGSASTSSLTNFGLLEGGNGAAAISEDGTWNLAIVNNGTIRAGAGQSNAIVFGQTAASTSTLELQAGSIITGNVVASASATNDTFRLGGTGSASFDVSTIGPAAQYRNFDVFEKTGAGTWSLTGTGTATTNWTVTEGTLQIGNGGTSGSLVGSITTSSAGTLAFNRSDAFAFDNLILGNGTLRQIGSGTTILTANNAAFAGTTLVEAGTLSVNGVLGGTVTVLGGRLQGNGTVGATTIAAGGTVAPGNSIGTLTVNGAYLQAAGSTYQVEIDPATVTSDLIRVNGAATLASGAAFTAVNYTGATLRAGQRYTILTSSGGLTGRYGSGDFAMTPFLSLRDSYDANNAYLTVIQTRTVASAGSTGNQAEVGRGVDSLPSGNSIQTGMLNQPTLDSARTALDQISGEIHASAKTALIDESWLLRAAVNDRLRAAFGGVGAAPMATLNYGFTADLAPSVKGPMPTLNADRFAVWGQGYGAWGRTGSDGNAARLTHSTGGFLLGADAALFDTLRIGAVAGYSRSVFDVNSRFSSGESDNYHLGLYGGGRWGALSLRTGASYSWHDVETSRTVVSSAFGSNLRAGYDAGTAQIFGEVGYRVDVGKLAFEPFAGLAYVNLHSSGFSETGGAAALTARGDDTSLGYSTLGLRASSSFALQGMDLTLRGGLAWRHAFGDVDPTTTLAFSGSSAFSIAGIPIARDAAIVEAGLDLAIGKSATLGLAYTGQLAQDTQDHAFKGVLAVRF
ncbi:outer membrane autotransporter protein [Bosea sp. BE125]|uniref:autotransporter outer membrane beta-barrel domain-containing protein n=1 Tax=Bosea sp. BE125 TaxID=2817909 RepID=UPI0028545FDB|nr:autotransporter domain-containing protein [Bosea sp. BE125]MDR6871360.1 outer membrane autotransporter protein [Bosea sp. BE125]